jgi:HSP20 family protein
MTALVESYPDWLRDINRLFSAQQRQAGQFMPPADVLVDDDGVTVHMDMPGVHASDLEIELQNDILTVRGRRPNPYEGAEAAVRHAERGFGRFERSLRVPPGLDPNAVAAELHDGVLTMRIPKPEHLKPHRIEVRAAEANGQSRQPQVSAGSGAGG